MIPNPTAAPRVEPLHHAMYPQRNTPMSRSKSATVLAAALAAAALAVLPATVADAAAPRGWVRIAHLSPDTKAVDITLSSLSGAKTPLFKLSNVSYGAVSKYMELPQGTYAIAMVPAGAPAGSTPVVNASVDVSSSKAETVAAIGLNKDLKTKVLSDDLDQTAGDEARVRVVNASTKHAEVDVTAASKSLGDDVQFGDATGYKSIPAGSTTFSLKSSGVTASDAVKLAAGSVHTVFVLDNSQGTLSLSSALDSSASTVTPVGSVQTGAGGAARADASSTGAAAGGLAAAAGLGAVGLAAAAVRRRRAEVQ